MSGLLYYTYFWFALLYLHLVFPKLIYSILYILLGCNIIPKSVMATSGLMNFDVRHVIPTSGMEEIAFIPSSVTSTYGAPPLIFSLSLPLFSPSLHTPTSNQSNLLPPSPSASATIELV